MKIGKHTIGKDIFIVAEIGSNHLGHFKLCLQMIREAQKCGADAVKLQKRDNRHMFTKEMYNSPYATEFSYGTTYGEHREKLDWFGEKEYKEIIDLCRDIDIVFFATAFDEKSADFLHALDMPCYKIASCDAKNFSLIEHVAQFGKPLIISTGGCDLYDIETLVYFLNPINKEFALMHCISTYPNTDEQLQLRFIKLLRDFYPNIPIGFSSHHPGLLPNIVAYMCGARLFEVHFTMNRAMGGTDHAFSYEPYALAKFCEDIRRIDAMLGNGGRTVLPEETQRGGFLHKMGKAVHVSRTLPAGHVISRDDICLKAPADGIPPNEMRKLIGAITLKECSTSDILKWEDFDYDKKRLLQRDR